MASLSDDAAATSAALAAAVTGPAEVSSDAGSVRQYGLADLISADRYLMSKLAMQNKNRGMRFNRIVPPAAADFRRPLPPWPYWNWR